MFYIKYQRMNILAEVKEMNGWEQFWYNLGQFFLEKDEHNLNYLTRIFIAIAIIVVGWFVIKLANMLLKRAFGIRKKGPNIDKSAKLFIVAIIRAFLWIGVAFAVIYILKIDITGFAGVVSAITVALGLALQDLIGCMFSGMLLLHQKIVHTGDYISVHNAYGVCEGKVDVVHLFFTYLITPQGQQIVIPNSNMTKATITNFSKLGKRRVDYDFCVSFDTDIEKAKKALGEIFETDDRVLQDEDHVVYVVELAAYAAKIRFRCWTTFENYWPFYNDLSEKILIACRKHKIHISSSTEISVKN